MKLLRIACFVAVSLALLRSVSGQSFTNLNFESANIPNSTPPNSPIPISAGLPGWSGYFASSTESNQATQVSYDGISGGGVVISVVDTNVGFSFFNPIQGNYSAYLFGGFGPGEENDTLYSAEISQTGLVPNGTKSLLIDAYVSGASFIVTLGGQTIDMTPLQTFSNYTLYGGDISSFAGDVEALSFTEPPAADEQPSMFKLDNIVFSPGPVPEPGVSGLSALGGLFLFWRMRRSNNATDSK
jgi:hypothetical protein